MFDERSTVGPYNLGNPNEISIRTLAEKVVTKTGSNSKIISVGAVPDDPRQRKPDISKVQAELGWVPKVSLDEGLEKSIKYFKKFLEANEKTS